MDTTSDRPARILLFLSLWLVCAAWSLYLPEYLYSISWFMPVASVVTLFFYILTAGSFSHLLVGPVIAGGRGIKVGFVFSACALVLLFLLHNRFSPSLPLALLQSLLLLTVSTLLGTALSSAITRIGELAPLALTAASADIVSVFFGPTKDMGEQLTAYYGEGMQGPPPLVDFFLLKAAAPGGIVQPLFGVSDWILVILFSSALIRLERSDNLLGALSASSRFRLPLFFPVTSAGLFVSLLVAGMLQIYIPALFFICFFFLCFLLFRCQLIGSLQGKDLIYCVLFPLLVAGGILLLA